MTKNPDLYDDIYKGLPNINAGMALHSYLMDEDTSPKKFTRSMSISMTPEMFQALQELAANKDLPFMGVAGNLGRHALAAFIESVEEFLDDDMRTIFRSLMLQQRRLTRERVLVTIDDVIEQQVEQLKFWTQRGKWAEIVRSLKQFLSEVDGYPTSDWREHVAYSWLRHSGVKGLMRLWSDRMQEESPDTWAKVRAFTERMEMYANV